MKIDGARPAADIGVGVISPIKGRFVEHEDVVVSEQDVSHQVEVRIRRPVRRQGAERAGAEHPVSEIAFGDVNDEMEGKFLASARGESFQVTRPAAILPANASKQSMKRSSHSP